MLMTSASSRLASGLSLLATFRLMPEPLAFLGEVRILLYALSTQDSPEGHPQDSHIQTQRLVLRIPHVAGQTLTPWWYVTSVNLCPTRDSGKDIEALPFLLCVEGHVFE
jgi:hypothetical protein